MELTGVHAIWIFLGSIALIGAFPVLLETYYENKPSKWQSEQHMRVATYHAPAVYLEQSKEDKEIQDFISLATKSDIQPSLPIATSDIPVFSADEITKENMVHSIPTDDMLEHVDELLSMTKDEEDYSSLFQFNNEIVEFERENVMAEGDVIVQSPLSLEEYNMIEKKFGTKVADMVTATPTGTFVSGIVTMIGRVILRGDDVFLKYSDELIKMVGNDLPRYNDEIVLISGHFIEPESFNVQGWEDPEIIQYGYADKEYQAVI
ncbi:hypothetical protein [Bacillus sp. FJAT-29937]|uniref:hypothetical protein n=1 Tax=Bacillus sp. FJAT-29937 TaxID=1720553 RepID=UPI00082D0C49|nr:hypothetical protein [Bacillus sp. FJAT-29937]